jgi:hypothetical protein
MPSYGGNINLTWSPDGRKLAVGNHDDKLLIIDLPNGGADAGEDAGADASPALMYSSTGMEFKYEVNQLAWGADSQHLIVATGENDLGNLQILMYAPPSAAAATENAEVKGAKAKKGSKAKDKDKDLAAAATSNNKVGCSGGTIAVLSTLPAHTSNCHLCKTDSQFSRLAVTSTDQNVSLWDLRDMVADKSFSYDGVVRGLSFSGDGKFIALCGQDNVVKIINATTGLLVHELTCPCKMTAVALHPTRQIIAFATAVSTEFKKCQPLRCVSFEERLQSVVPAKATGRGRGGGGAANATHINPRAKAWTPKAGVGEGAGAGTGAARPAAALSFQELLAAKKMKLSQHLPPSSGNGGNGGSGGAQAGSSSNSFRGGGERGGGSHGHGGPGGSGGENTWSRNAHVPASGGGGGFGGSHNASGSQDHGFNMGSGSFRGGQGDRGGGDRGRKRKR